MNNVYMLYIVFAIGRSVENVQLIQFSLSIKFISVHAILLIMSIKKIICLLSLILLISPVSAMTVIPKPREKYTCVDYSLEYARNNPDWGIVTMSQNQYFRGTSHMVNYQLNPDGSLNIHDGLYDRDYTLYDWENEGFYHFWLTGEKPCRYYKVMQDNTQKFLALN